MKTNTSDKGSPNEGHKIRPYIPTKSSNCRGYMACFIWILSIIAFTRFFLNSRNYPVSRTKNQHKRPHPQRGLAECLLRLSASTGGERQNEMPKFKKQDPSEHKIHRQPHSSATSYIHAMIEAGREGINDLPARQKLVNHKTKCTVNRSVGLMHEDMQIEFKNSLGYIMLEMPNDLFDELTGEFKSNVKKMFQFVLAQVEAQAFRDGKLTQDTVTFSGHELVDIGLYSEEWTADRGIKAAMSILTSIKLMGSVRYSPKMKPISIYSLDVMFYSIISKNAEFTVFLNDKIDWNFVIYFFSHIPTYYYELSSRAASLAYQIFYLARQHTKEIKEDGKFTISLKAVRNALSIPLRATKNAKRDIVEEFYRAVDELEAAHQKHFHNSELELFIINGDSLMSPAQFIQAINTGNAALEVNISGQLAKPFIDFEEQKAKKRKEAIARARAARTRKTSAAS